MREISYFLVCIGKLGKTFVWRYTKVWNNFCIETWSNTDGYIVFTVQRFQVVGNANEEVLDLTQGSFLTCSLVEGKNNEIKLTYLRPDIERNYKIEIAPSASNDKERTQVVRQLNKILLEAGQNPNSKIKIGPVLAGIPTMPNATFKSVEVVGAL